MVPSSISKDPFIYAHGEVGNFSPTLLVEVEIVILKYRTLSTSPSLVQREREGKPTRACSPCRGRVGWGADVGHLRVNGLEFLPWPCGSGDRESASICMLFLSCCYPC